MTFAERRMISEAIDKIAKLEERVVALEAAAKPKPRKRQGEAHVVGQ